MTDKRGTVRNVTLRPQVDRYIRYKAREWDVSLAAAYNRIIRETIGFERWQFADSRKAVNNANQR